MTRAVLYARYSPRPDADTSESNLTQLELCRTYAVRQGWDVAGEHEDQALSGDDEERPGLWAAVDALKRGDVLLVYKLDRLARSVYLSHVIEQAVSKAGARIISVCGEGTWQDTPEDRLIRQILQALAEYQKRAGAARTKAAMQRHQRSGRRMGRVSRGKGSGAVSLVPYGSRPDPADDRRLVAHDQERATILRIAELAGAGLGCCAIARTLRNEGVTARGKRWHPETVRRILARTKGELT